MKVGDTVFCPDGGTGIITDIDDNGLATIDIGNGVEVKATLNVLKKLDVDGETRH